MGETRRIEIEIDAGMLAAADDAVENGRFADRDAVIAHALGFWNDEVSRVRRLIDEGFASGDPVEGNPLHHLLSHIGRPDRYRPGPARCP